MEGQPTVVAATSTAEARLVGRIRSGDRLAEEELIVTYQRGVFAIAAARTRDREASRDLAQDVLIAVLKALRQGQLRESDKLVAFIQGTARNLINNYLRKQGNRAEVELAAEEVPGADPIQEMESAERHRLIQLEIRSFNTTDQQILLLSLVDGHSLAEVAQRLNMSHDSVRARKSRMLRKITKKFAALSHK
jgi:RNA polymerase sigma-70 factor (ECF subfamily)